MQERNREEKISFVEELDLITLSKFSMLRSAVVREIER